MIGGNGSKRLRKGQEMTRELNSSRCFDLSMPQCAITLAPDPGNSELP